MSPDLVMPPSAHQADAPFGCRTRADIQSRQLRECRRPPQSRVVQIEPGPCPTFTTLAPGLGQKINPRRAGDVAGNNRQLGVSVADHAHRVATPLLKNVRSRNRHGIPRRDRPARPRGSGCAHDPTRQRHCAWRSPPRPQEQSGNSHSRAGLNCAFALLRDTARRP